MEDNQLKRRSLLHDEEYQKPANAQAVDWEEPKKAAAPKKKLLDGIDENNSKVMRVSEKAVTIIKDCKSAMGFDSDKEALEYIVDHFYKKTKSRRNPKTDKLIRE